MHTIKNQFNDINSMSSFQKTIKDAYPNKSLFSFFCNFFLANDEYIDKCFELISTNYSYLNNVIFI